MKNSPVTRFIWIRHAPVEKETGYVPDYDPNARYDAGAAERLGRAMPENARWIMSPLKRTRQTAEQVRQHLNHQAQHPEDEHIEPDIIEQDLGRWAGAQLADVWQELAPLPKHNFSFQRAETQPPDGEKFADQCVRIAAYLNAQEVRIAAKKDTRTHVMFAHAHTIRAVIAHCFGLAPDTALSIAVDNYSRTIFDYLPPEPPVTGSLTPAGGNWQLMGLNLPATEA